MWYDNGNEKSRDLEEITRISTELETYDFLIPIAMLLLLIDEISQLKIFFVLC